MADNSYLAKELIYAARTRLLMTHPFYGRLAQRFKLREDFDQPTMATDSVTLMYNPDFVTKLTKAGLVAVLAHEVEHVYRDHVPRMMRLVPDWSKNPQMVSMAQIAADMAVNPPLKDGGFELPGDAVYPERDFWDDTLEGHFSRIKQKSKNKGGNGKGHGDGCTGHCSGIRPLRDKNGKPMSPAEISQIEQETQVSVLSAADFARAAGRLPGYISRFLGDVVKPKVSWKEVLRRFMQATSKSDYRMMPPNRRYIHQGLYLPSLHSDAVGTGLLIMDGSGSTCNVFDQFIAEFASILLDIRPEKLLAMCWDTQCTWKQEFDGYSDETERSLAAMKAKMGAGGGTVFTDCFNFVSRECDTAPQFAVVLTDMELYGGWPEDPGYPVIWIATADIVAPYGETVRIQI